MYAADVGNINKCYLNDKGNILLMLPSSVGNIVNLKCWSHGTNGATVILVSKLSYVPYCDDSSSTNILYCLGQQDTCSISLEV